MSLSNTTLVNIDGDVAQNVAQFIGSKLGIAEESATYVEECSKLIADANIKGLIEKFMSKHAVLLDLDGDIEVVDCFETLFSTIYLMLGNNQEGALVNLIISILTGNTSHAPKRRLAVLVALVNLCYTSESKVDILLGLFSYALSTSQSALVSGLYSRLDDWTESWKLSSTQRRFLLQQIIPALRADKQDAKALHASIAYIETLKGQNLAQHKDASQLIQSALVFAISTGINDFSTRVSLYESLQNISLTGDLVGLKDLLRVLCDGSLADYQTFSTSHADLFSKYSLSKQDIENKLKLLGFSSYVAHSSVRVLSYAKIGEVMQVQEGEVEEYVVEAIASGLIEASIDQMQGTVTVSRCTYRSFGSQDWRALQKSLSDLNTKLSTSLTSLDKAKAVTV